MIHIGMGQLARAERLTSCQQRMNLLIKEEAATTSYDTRLVIEGEIDAYTAPQLREKLLPLCKEHQKISIDLSGVNYMDSTGLGVLIGAYKLLKAGSGKLVLIGPNQRLRRLFNITGLSEIFKIEDKVQGDEE